MKPPIPMRKGPAVHRAMWVGAAAVAASASQARRRPAAALTIAAAAGLAGVAAFSPRNPVFGRALWRGPRDRPRAAVTFDDGPGPTTPEVLDVLAREGVRATFFVLGRQVDRHPEVVRRMVAEGHQVANHGYDHGILIFRGARHVRDQLARTERAVERAVGSDATSRALPRPPRVPRAGHRARLGRGRLPDGRVDDRRLRLGRARAPR